MPSTGPLDLPALTALVDAGEIDTVVVAFTDLQGRLVGKRVTGRFFLDHVLGPESDPGSGEGIEACDYLLAVDVDMNVVEGYRFANWEAGYGDFRGRPDLAGLIPARCEHAQRAQCYRGSGRRAQHLRAQPNRDGAGFGECGDLLR